MARPDIKLDTREEMLAQELPVRRVHDGVIYHHATEEDADTFLDEARRILAER